MAYLKELRVGMAVVVHTRIHGESVQFLGLISSIKQDLEYGVFVSAEDTDGTWAWVRPSEVQKIYD